MERQYILLRSFLTDPVLLCRTLFLFATSVVLAVNTFHPLRTRLVKYGPRQENQISQEKTNSNSTNDSTSFLDIVAAWQVPHSWFTHFYVVSILSSIFWAFQILAEGYIYSSILWIYYLTPKDYPSMTANQIALTWGLMTAQGVRRLYECITLSKPSNSKISILHWIMGIAFYVGAGIAVWIEGTPTLATNGHLLESINISKPSPKTFLGVIIFLLASGFQHDCHAYLANLKKYSLPELAPFQYVLCPHYTCECLIYLGLAVVAAPKGEAFNKTFCTLVLLEAVNLGVTAETTRVWYEEKFGKQRIQGRWRMVPFLY